MISIFLINVLIMAMTSRADKKRRAYDKKELQTTNLKNLLQMSVSTPAIDIVETGLTQLSKSKTKKTSQVNHCDERKQALMKDKFSFRFRPLYLNNEQSLEKNSRISYSHKINTILVLVSFSYVILNLPYLITWYVFQ
jgi:hypothetical protein